MKKPIAHPIAALFLIAGLLNFVTACGGGSSPPPANPPSITNSSPSDTGSTTPGATNPPPPPVALSTGPADCVDGKADEFACMGIALEKRVGLDTMEGIAGNDLWGWADPDTGNEYALMGMSDGIAFVDVTNPQTPVYLGRLRP